VFSCSSLKVFLNQKHRHSRALRAKYEAGEIPKDEYELEESLEKNRISNISTVRG
jgi:hypothetical protein